MSDRQIIGIVGINGLVGSAIKRRLVELEHEVYEVDFRRNKKLLPQGSVVIACGNPSKFLAHKNPEKFLEAEIKKHLPILESASKNKNQVVLISSTEIELLSNFKEPNTPEHIKSRISAYSYTKLALEYLTSELTLKPFIARLCGVLSDRSHKGSIHDLCKNGNSWINPETEIQLISEDSMAKYLVDGAINKRAYGVFNIVPSGYIAWGKFIEITRSQISFQADNPKYTLVADNGPLRKLLGYPVQNCEAEIIQFVKEII